VGHIAVTALLCATTAFAQENRGTPEQRAACAPDAFRLCAGVDDLSDAFRSVFEQSAGLVTSRTMRPKSFANAAETPCEPATRS
jgi:hypothetical protein